MTQATKEEQDAAAEPALDTKASVEQPEQSESTKPEPDSVDAAADTTGKAGIVACAGASGAHVGVVAAETANVALPSAVSGAGTAAGQIAGPLALGVSGVFAAKALYDGQPEKAAALGAGAGAGLGVGLVVGGAATAALGPLGGVVVGGGAALGADLITQKVAEPVAKVGIDVAKKIPGVDRLSDAGGSVNDAAHGLFGDKTSKSSPSPKEGSEHSPNYPLMKTSVVPAETSGPGVVAETQKAFQGPGTGRRPLMAPA